MTWSYTYHRFADRDAYLAACNEATFTTDDNGNPLAPMGTALDVIGTIWTGGTPDPETGFPVGQTPLPGYHVNCAWLGDMPASFQESLLDPGPANPVRVWA